MQRAVKKYLLLEHDFICLSDIKCDEYEVVPLIHDWPGWWSKIELFRPHILTGHTIYLDLDTLIVGDIGRIVEAAPLHGFLMLDDWFGHSGVNSGMMGWSSSAKLYLTRIYEKFIVSPRKHRGHYNIRARWGDQAFIRDHTPIKPAIWQHEFPGKIVSYKRDCQNGIPEDASIVCFHGKPRPWKTKYWDTSSDTP